jgi:hypothetical protein
MTFILIYGSDGCGKSVQSKSIAETNNLSEHWSFTVKNRKLYETSGVNSVELLRFNEDSTVNPYKTIDAFRDQINNTIKENTRKLIVIDEITQLRSWAQPVVVEEINKTRRAYQKPPITKIGENNLAGWARVNQIVYGEIERLTNWSVINDVVIIAITGVTEKRRSVVDQETGETKSVTTGEIVVDAKENIRKLADVRIKLEKDGSKGRGYYAFFEKQQDWMNPGADAVKVDKNGVLTELMLRGVIE